MPERLKVVFAYMPRHHWNGSKIMRVDQLRAIADLHLGHLYDFQAMQLFREGQNRAMRFALRDLSGAVVIFLKGGGNCFPVQGLERLKEIARGICIDHVDGVFGPGASFRYADVHIVASHAALRAGRSLLISHPDSFAADAQIELLTHHPDPRIVWRDASSDTALKPGYFGLPKNVYLPETLKDRFSDADLEHGAPFAEMLERMERANLHYAVRPLSRARMRGAHVYKPFTKGFNAARAGANMIINRDADDALEYLGDDYPYLVDANDPAMVAEAFEKAEKDVGGKDWKMGLSAMSSVRARSSHEHIAAELRGILARFR